MDPETRNAGLLEAMEESSMLSRHEPAEFEAHRLIVEALSGALEPGERVLAYVDRDLHADQIDALAYDEKGAEKVPDVMGYRPGGPEREIDAFAYDQESGRKGPDVMGYRPGGTPRETDALAYDRPPETPENDVLVPPGEPRPTDVDFLVLTGSRLLRGFLEDGRAMITETPFDDPQVRIIAESYMAIRLPDEICGLNEGGWWCWRVPEGMEPRSVAKRWSRRS